MALDESGALGDRLQHRVLVDVVQLELPTVSRGCRPQSRASECRRESFGDAARGVRDTRGGHDHQRAKARASCD
jgi:hypothetical protein